MRRSIPLLAATLFAATLLACQRSAPRLPSPDALAAEVTIRRDEFGIPHILASTEEAAAFGFGYAQAEDHAAEIGRRYLSARGQEARYFGESGLANDAGMAQFENAAEAERALEKIPTTYRRLISAYAAGVNRYAARHRAELPAWMPLVSAADVLAYTRAPAVDALSGPRLPRLLRQKYEGLTEASPAASDHEPVDQPGSNAFALAGLRTTTGKPILLGNPHLNWSSLYWEAHVRVPGRIDFYGSTLAGIPVLRAGFNDRLGFVTTNNAPDLDDVFALTLDRSRSDHYMFDGRPVPLERRDVTIAVRTAQGALRHEPRTFWRSHLGPIIYRTATQVFAVKSTRLEAFRYFEGFYALSKARNLREWMAAMRQNLVPTSNFTYADADGNILYLWNGRVPMRMPGRDYRLDVDARSSADVWTRLHRIDELPQLLNPRGGYVQNANNPPQFVSLRDPIDMTRYPESFERGTLALRPQLALDLLESRTRFSVADVIRLKYDTRMLLAERVKQSLVDAVRTAPQATPEARAGAEALEAWDGTVSAWSRGGALFVRFWERYATKVPQPFARPWDPRDPLRTPAGIGDPAAAVTQLDEAVRAMRASVGSEHVAWGEVNRFRSGPLDLPGEGAPGTYGCFRVMRFDEVPGGHHRAAGTVAAGEPPAGFGDAWVLLVDFSRPGTAWSVLAYGQTTDWRSPHSRDQLRIFAHRQLRRAWYAEQEVAAHTRRTYRP